MDCDRKVVYESHIFILGANISLKLTNFMTRAHGFYGHVNVKKDSEY